MGGRGSLGGTRSTYRGNSTQLFLQRQQQQSNSSNRGGGGGGGGGTRTRGQSGADTGGIQTGGGNGGGGGTAVEDRPDSGLIDVSEDSFHLTDEYKELAKKYSGNPDVFERVAEKAYEKWLASRKVQSPDGGLSPKPAAALDKFRKAPSKARTPSEQALLDDIRKINPKYDDLQYNLFYVGSTEKARQNAMFRINCQRCVVAQEARDRGYDVTAVSVEEGWLPVSWNAEKGKHNFKTESADYSELASLFKKSDGTSPEWEWKRKIIKNRIPAIKDLESKILAWGEGSRGILFFQYDTGGMHVINVKVINGKIVYTDGQNSEIEGVGLAGWKSKFDPQSEWNGVLRVDNTTITERGTTWMRERTPLEINAPSIEELNDFIKNKAPEVQVIWRHIWQQVRTGNRPTLPTSYGDIPEALEAAKEAAAWTRRPD